MCSSTATRCRRRRSPKGAVTGRARTVEVPTRPLGMATASYVDPPDSPPRLLRRHRDDLHEAVEFPQVVRIACVEGKPGGKSGCRDEQIEGARPPRLPAGGGDCGIDAAVSAR